jgi:LacI family transcriptional regulator
MTNQGKRPTIEDVAKRAGVSNVTVSRVVNGEKWVSEQTRQEVETAMRELGYRANAAARSMRSGKTHSVGFIMADLTNGFNALVAETAQSALMDAGYMMFVASSHFDTDRERRLIHFLEERQVDGLLLSLNDDADLAVIAELNRLRVPFVALDRDVSEKFDAVLFDHETCIRSAVEHLVAFGHRRIAFFAASTRYRVGRQRYAAFSGAMAAAGLDVDESLVRNREQTEEYAFQEALTLFTAASKPTAVLAAGNQILFGVFKAIRMAGLRVPQDVSVIGGDEPNITELFTPPITILDRDIRLFAKTATNFLITRLNGSVSGPGRRAVLPTRLTVRESCGPSGVYRVT